MTDTILAVDIGASGAVALLDPSGGPLDVVDLPTLESGPACRPEISPALLAAIVRRWGPSRVWVEWIGPRAGDRPAGAFSFGASKAGRGLKDLARSRAIERWPAHADLFARKLDHDRAEAALIGWAGLQREGLGR